MEQLSIRDWMILIGGTMIAAVLIDALRRYWRERRAEIKLNARIERASPLSEDDDAFNLLTELPNGGARIVQRDDLQIDDPQAATPVLDATAPESGAPLPSRDEPAPDPIDVAVAVQLAESPGAGPDEYMPVQTERASDDPALREPVAVDSPLDAASAKPGADPSEPAVDAGAAEDSVSAMASETVAKLPKAERAETASRRRTVKPAPETAEKVPTADASGTVDWLDTLEPEEPLESDAPEHGRLPRGANTHVFILYVVAQAEEGFAGTDILETLLACDLRFGDMDFFHRHERASGRGPIEFSVANMMKPGVFDIDNMEPLQTRGLMFFVTLPGPADMLKAFDYMYETAKVVAKSLGGDIQDETRSMITRQSLEHMRQQIRELERRLLVRRN
jgi:cell division protein ZipA